MPGRPVQEEDQDIDEHQPEHPEEVGHVQETSPVPNLIEFSNGVNQAHTDTDHNDDDDDDGDDDDDEDEGIGNGETQSEKDGETPADLKVDIELQVHINGNLLNLSKWSRSKRFCQIWVSSQMIRDSGICSTAAECAPRDGEVLASNSTECYSNQLVLFL